MPTQLQLLRARAIHAYFRSREGVDSHIYQLIFAFCDCPPTVFSHRRCPAFVLLTDWGSVVTWGKVGSYSTGVAAKLSGGVQTIVGNDSAFAAVKVDGSVVTWGKPECGGDSRAVAAHLSDGVQTVLGTV